MSETLCTDLVGLVTADRPVARRRRRMSKTAICVVRIKIPANPVFSPAKQGHSGDKQGTKGDTNDA